VHSPARLRRPAFFRGVLPRHLCAVTACLLIFAGPARAGIDPVKYKVLRLQAELHELQGDWDKACLVYETILRLDRALPEIQERYQSALRRAWQVQRHTDYAYRKEVLSLDYAQSLRLYTMIRDTLLDNALDKRKADPGQLLRKGLDELDKALALPIFVQQYLADAKPAQIRVFRELLKKTWTAAEKISAPNALKSVRELGLAAQNLLQLSPSVVFMELACGACYAIDEYTLYLTPTQLRELCDSLRGEASEDNPAPRLPSVAFQMKSEHVGYIQIGRFQDSTVQEVDEALGALNKDGMKTLILDLRGNHGGLFESAIDVARRFLATGVIASTQYSDPKYNAVYQARNPGAVAVPLVVLIDGGTASAAEVLAGAIKDNKRGRLIGQTTFGKGCTQCILKLPPAPGGVPTGGMRLTVARFFSPLGQPYSGRGILPHVAIECDPSAFAGPFDTQLDAAMIEMERFLQGRAQP